MPVSKKLTAVPSPSSGQSRLSPPQDGQMLTRKGQIRQGASRWRLPSPAKWSELQFWVLSCSVWKPQTGLAPSSEAEHVPACAACIRWPARNVRAAIAQLVSWAATVRNAVSDSHKQPVEVEELLRLDG